MNRREFFVGVAALAMGRPALAEAAPAATCQKITLWGIQEEGKDCFWCNVQLMKRDEERGCFVPDGPQRRQFISHLGRTVRLGKPRTFKARFVLQPLD